MGDVEDRSFSNGAGIMRIEDYEDADLIIELRSRGYAVYKGKEMQKSIAQLERLQDNLLSKLNALKQLR